MKPAAVVFVLSLGVFAGRAAAQSQAPWQFAEPPGPLPSNYVGDHFAPGPTPWSPRLHEPPADAFLWTDYRGAYIEHDLYRPRYLSSPVPDTAHSRPLLSALGDWLNSLFAWLPTRRQRACQHCVPMDAIQHGAAHEGVTLPPPAHFDVRTPLANESLVAPTPLPDREPAVAPQPPPGLEPAPLVELPPNVIPPAPPSVSAPRASGNRPPVNEIPPRLVPPRTPVVELAPEPANVGEPPPAPTVPRNRVPRPGQQLPRNAVPRSTGGR